MNYTINRMEENHRQYVLDMMRVFYRSDAVLTNGSEEIFTADIDACVNDNPYLEGYVFQSDNEILGYTMIAKSFSTEFGKRCIWIEDIYLKEEYRGMGLATAFFKMLEEKYSDAIFRLEAEEENRRAIKTYRKNGFTVMPYLEMKK